MEAYPFVYGAVGVHPDDAEIMTQDTLDEIRRLSHMEKMVAIGEIGLDYYWHKEESEHQRQQEMFRAQMDIAREEKLPFMIHSRDAAEDTLNIVRVQLINDVLDLSKIEAGVLDSLFGIWIKWSVSNFEGSC